MKRSCVSPGSRPPVGWPLRCLLLVLGWPLAASAVGTHNDNATFTEIRQMQAADWDDPRELARTWRAALVAYPGPGGKVIDTTMASLAAGAPGPDRPLPTVIYLHGCSGVWHGTYFRLRFLARHGFAVIAPVSLAREKYPMSCDPASHRGGFYRATLVMRQNDARHAIESARALPWVDRRNLFLMGLSQGAITTATLRTDAGSRVNARIVEGWTCHAGWREYRGVNAPPSEPVLSLVARDDPWFQREWLRGDCGRWLDPDNGSVSHVFSSEHLRARHELLEDSEVQSIVLDFFARHRRD